MPVSYTRALVPGLFGFNGWPCRRSACLSPDQARLAWLADLLVPVVPLVLIAGVLATGTLPAVNR